MGHRGRGVALTARGVSSLVPLLILFILAPPEVRAQAPSSPRVVRVVDTLLVTSSRGARGLGHPGGISVVHADRLVAGADGSVDQALRGTPGFGLFRRAPSLASNPTTQGVSLRGLAASGGSRALVLADGAPLNDAFGSWVSWNRIPLAAIERIEVVRGSPSDLYGPDAVGGVVQLLTYRPGLHRLRLLAEGASYGTGRASAFASGSHGPWVASIGGEWLHANGYVTVAPESRGAVDVPADVSYRTGFAEAGADLASWSWRLRGSAFGEERGNGTPLQLNDTHLQQVEGDVNGAWSRGTWRVRGAAAHERYHQTFSAVAPGRTSERLTSVQEIPTRSGNLLLLGTLDGARVSLLAGSEVRGARSQVEETRDPTGQPTVVQSGGGEVAGGVFARAHADVGTHVAFVLGMRVDRWRSTPRDATEPRHAATLASPRVAAEVQAGPSLWTLAGYEAWRTPTLNELHRAFRVGSVVTLANPTLDPERLRAAELGVAFPHLAGSPRVTAFLHRLDDAIANVTLSETPALITRQRKNTQELRAQGLELELEASPFTTLRGTGFATWTRSWFASAPETPELEGRRVPQVPEWQVGGRLEWDAPGAVFARLELRASGRQFEDDVNHLALRPFSVVDAVLRRPVHGWETFLAISNAFDTEYDVGRTPLRSIGMGRAVRGGIVFARGE